MVKVLSSLKGLPCSLGTAQLLIILLSFDQVAEALPSLQENRNKSEASLGRVASWGVNSDGQLGLGDIGSSRYLPIAVAGLGENIVDISAGECHSIALTNTGEVWVWGCDLWSSVPSETGGDSATPLRVHDLSGIVDVSAGRHSNALTEDGFVWQWGFPAFAWSPTVDFHLPWQVEGLADIVAIDTGTTHSLALRDDGKVFAWGSNSYGQLGVEELGWPPQPIPGVSNIVAIDAGHYHSIALSADGTVWAWGQNGYGQVGDGTYIDRYSPVRVRFSSGAILNEVIAIAAAGSYSLSLRSDGTVWAWGHHEFEPDSEGVPYYEIVPVPSLTGVVAIAAGYEHSLAIKNDGTVWAWGDDSYGQLGDGPGTNPNETTQTLYLRNATTVSAGDSFSLVINRPFREEYETENAWVLSSDFPMSDPAVFDNWSVFWNFELGETAGFAIGLLLAASLGFSAPALIPTLITVALIFLGISGAIISEYGEQWDPVFLQPIVGDSMPYVPDGTCISLSPGCWLAEVCDDYSTRLGATIYLDFIGKPAPFGPHDASGFEELVYYVGCPSWDQRFSWTLISEQDMKNLDTTKTYIVIPKQTVMVNDLFMSYFCWPPSEVYFHAAITPGLREDVGVNIEYVECVTDSIFSDGFESGNAIRWSATTGSIQ